MHQKLTVTWESVVCKTTDSWLKGPLNSCKTYSVFSSHSVGPQNIWVGCSKSWTWRIKFRLSSQHPTVIVWRPTYLSNVILIIHLRIYISQFPKTDFVSGYCDIWAAAILVDVSPRWTRLWVSGELFWWAIHPADQCVCKRDRWTWAAYLFMVRPDNRLPHVWRALEPPPNCVCWPKPLFSKWNHENCTSISLILFI